MADENQKSPPLTDQQDKFIQSQIDSGNRHFYENFDKPVSSIYVDMDFFQDYKLGALMNMLTTDVEYEYIKSQIDAYNQSDNENVTEMFPALGFTEEQVEAFVKDPANTDLLVLESPFYTTMYQFIIFMENVFQSNLIKKFTESTELFVGCGSFPFPACGWNAFVGLFEPYLHNTNINFLPTTLYEFQGRAVDDYDVYLVRHASELINHPLLVKKFENMEMTSKFVVGMVENKATEEDLKAYSITKEEAIKVTVEFANIFTHFALAERVIQV